MYTNVKIDLTQGENEAGERGGGPPRGFGGTEPEELGGLLPAVLGRRGGWGHAPPHPHPPAQGQTVRQGDRIEIDMLYVCMMLFY